MADVYAGDLPNGYHLLKDGVLSREAFDVVPVVRCKDCIYWQKPQVWQNGTFRDYTPEELESMKNGMFFGVTLDVGVNYGSFCALYNRHHINRIPQFMGENDFCSKGYKAGDGNG